MVVAPASMAVCTAVHRKSRSVRVASSGDHWTSTPIDLAWLTKLLSVIWIVAVINSFNMLDNMDGLSGGVALIAAGGLAILMLLSKDPETGKPQLFVAGLLLVLAGALLGFLFHNRPPARIFMGDAGSYFIGFSFWNTKVFNDF